MTGWNEGVAQCEQHPGVVWPHGDCPGPGMPLLAEPSDERVRVPIGDGTVNLLLSMSGREARLVKLLRDCQFAVTGPAELRQRIEDEIGR